MARKSRKENAVKTPDRAAVAEKSYKTAIYIRLSVEDERKIESDSVENQRAFLADYVAKQDDLLLVDTYMDRGVTGTKFDRPQFNRMIADMRAGKINCIVVKDLSRLGRDYLEAGDYIEKIFPFFGVRFIAVTDGYDSLHASSSEDGFVVPLKNLINEAYAKDISKKISSTYESMYRAGLYPCCTVPYGYLKDPDDKRNMLVDENVRDVVVRIFNERLSGVSMCQIARNLNEDGILAPSPYWQTIGVLKTTKFSNVKWEMKAIRRLLMNPIYVGDVEMRKTRSALYKGIRKETPTAKEERIYVENHHEAIIDRETFNKVQELLREQRAEYDAAHGVYGDKKNRKENLFRGVIYCADCGHAMGLYRKTVKLPSGYFYYNTYTCNRAGTYLDDDPHKNVKAEDLEAMVLELVKTHIRTYLDASAALDKANKSSVAKKEMKALQKEKKKLTERKEHIAGVSANLYGDYTDGLFSESEYLDMKKDYQAEIVEIEKKLGEIENELATFEDGYGEETGLGKACRKYEGIDSLTGDMVRCFITKIVCSASDKFDVHYRFENDYKLITELVEKRKGMAG